MSETTKGIVSLFGLIAIVAGSLAWWVIGSSIEAQAYNRVTGSNVTTWEAMFLQLRVQGDAKDAD